MDKSKDMYDGPTYVDSISKDNKVPFIGKSIYGEKYGLGLLVAFLTLCGEKVLNKNAQANNRRNRHTLRRT